VAFTAINANHGSRKPLLPPAVAGVIRHLGHCELPGGRRDPEAGAAAQHFEDEGGSYVARPDRP
jgi:hypothetical protein